jgi:hypothetical protein
MFTIDFFSLYFTFSCLDEKTREEFLSWMRAFPHLRVVGTAIKYEMPAKPNPVEHYEEIIAIDPPRYEGESFKQLDQELNEKLCLRRSRQMSGKNSSKGESLEKLLRITSSGLNRNIKAQNARKVVDRTSTVVLKQSSSTKKLSQIEERDILEQEKLSYSASSSRIGPILNVKFLYKKPDILDNIKSVKSASKLPLYELRSIDHHRMPSQNDFSSKSASMHAKNINLIQLPPFNFELDNFPIIQGRSIQSAVGKTSSRNLKH